MRITINHINRIEGHAGFIGHVLNGKVFKAKIEVDEAARLIEGISRGRHFSEAPIIMSRICGVCPVIHNLTSIKAIEAALDLKVSKEVKNLRKLMLYGQIFQSHGFHLFFLSLADFFNLANDIKLVKKYPLQAKWAILIRNFGNRLVEVIGGRDVHPIATEIGGFKKWPDKQGLKKLYEESKKILESAINLAIFFKKLNYPEFSRETNFISLTHQKEYPVYEGDLKKLTTHNSQPITKIIPVNKFIHNVQEIQEPYEAVKRTRYQGEIFMVGALARVNNNYQKLNREAKEIWNSKIKKLPLYNVFYNIFAQAVELVHFAKESQKLLKEVLPIANRQSLIASHKAISNKRLAISQTGVAACEAPRGTLYYYYKINKNGLIEDCNIITPTAQFLKNLEEDIKIFLPDLKKLSKKEREKKIRMLIRAYDPCISCAVH